MDAIEVTARFDPKGNILPLTFVWQKRTYKVLSIGRHWKAEDGYHTLVMDPGFQTYHLIFQWETGKWFLFHGADGPSISWV